MARELYRLKENIIKKVLNGDPKKFYEQQIADHQNIFGVLNKISMKYEDFFESTAFFLGATLETTTLTMANVLLFLGMNPNAQNKLYEELKTVLKSSKDHVDEYEMEKMQFLDCVIKESLRLLPLTFMLSRYVTKPLKLKKYTLPVGTKILIPTLEAHLNGEIWGADVLEFKPERFEKGNFEKINSSAFLPFSGGLRICPGMKYATISMKIFLSRFLMEYKVYTDIKYIDLDLLVGLSIKPKQEPIIEIEKRT